MEVAGRGESTLLDGWVMEYMQPPGSNPLVSAPGMQVATAMANAQSPAACPKLSSLWLEAHVVALCRVSSNGEEDALDRRFAWPLLCCHALAAHVPAYMCRHRHALNCGSLQVSVVRVAMCRYAKWSLILASITSVPCRCMHSHVLWCWTLLLDQRHLHRLQNDCRWQVHRLH